MYRKYREAREAYGERRRAVQEAVQLAYNVAKAAGASNGRREKEGAPTLHRHQKKGVATQGENTGRRRIAGGPLTVPAPGRLGAVCFQLESGRSRGFNPRFF